MFEPCGLHLAHCYYYELIVDPLTERPLTVSECLKYSIMDGVFAIIRTKLHSMSVRVILLVRLDSFTVVVVAVGSGPSLGLQVERCWQD